MNKVLRRYGVLKSSRLSRRQPKVGEHLLRLRVVDKVVRDHWAQEAVVSLAGRPTWPPFIWTVEIVFELSGKRSVTTIRPDNLGESAQDQPRPQSVLLSQSKGPPLFRMIKLSNVLDVSGREPRRYSGNGFVIALCSSD